MSLSLEGDNFIGADHPINVYRGWICICHKKTLTIQCLKLSYRNYLEERPGLNERPSSQLKKFNERPGLNECAPQTREGRLFWKFAISAETLIQIVCKNN